MQPAKSLIGKQVHKLPPIVSKYLLLSDNIHFTTIPHLGHIYISKSNDEARGMFPNGDERRESPMISPSSRPNSPDPRSFKSGSLPPLLSSLLLFALPFHFFLSVRFSRSQKPLSNSDPSCACVCVCCVHGFCHFCHFIG